jgi:hypothetical protein
MRQSEMDKSLLMMGKVDGYRMQQSSLVKTNMASAGYWYSKYRWLAFKPMSC